MISHLDDIMDNERYSEPNWERKYKVLKLEYDKLKKEFDALNKVTAAETPKFKVGEEATDPKFKIGDWVRWFGCDDKGRITHIVSEDEVLVYCHSKPYFAKTDTITLITNETT